MKKLVNVSAIIPCYCASSTIKRAVISIVKQSFLPKEIIIIDDQSDDVDKTECIIKEIKRSEKDIDIKFIKLNVNVGAGKARNIGWNIATGEYIAFLDADDVWHPKKIELQYTFMLKNRKIDMSGHEYVGNISNYQEFVRQIKFINLNNVQYQSINQKILFHNCFSTPTVMMKRNIPIYFRGSKRYSEDYDLWCRLALTKNIKCVKLYSKLAAGFKKMYGEAGLSSSLWKMEKSELENYKTYYKEKKITTGIFIFASAISFVKYIRRILLVKCRKGKR